MITFDNPHMTLYMESDGKFFEVTAICDDLLEANVYCEANPDEGVIAEDRQQGRVYIARTAVMYSIGSSRVARGHHER